LIFLFIFSSVCFKCFNPLTTEIVQGIPAPCELFPFLFAGQQLMKEGGQQER